MHRSGLKHGLEKIVEKIAYSFFTRKNVYSKNKSKNEIEYLTEDISCNSGSNIKYIVGVILNPIYYFVSDSYPVYSPFADKLELDIMLFQKQKNIL